MADSNLWLSSRFYQNKDTRQNQSRAVEQGPTDGRIDSAQCMRLKIRHVDD